MKALQTSTLCIITTFQPPKIQISSHDKQIHKNAHRIIQIRQYSNIPRLKNGIKNQLADPKAPSQCAKHTIGMINSTIQMPRYTFLFQITIIIMRLTYRHFSSHKSISHDNVVREKSSKSFSSTQNANKKTNTVIICVL